MNKIIFRILFLAVVFILFSFTIFPQEKLPGELNFREFVEKRLRETYDRQLKDICPLDTNPVARRVFQEYGAVFIAGNGAVLPSKCILENDSQVLTYQTNVKPQTEYINGITVTLQAPAMKAFLDARKEAGRRRLKITPRGTLASGRSFQITLDLWNKRLYQALEHWVKKGKISLKEAEVVKFLPVSEQVSKVLGWESRGFYFSLHLDKSIFYSASVPGASQHNFLLALDVEQFTDKQVRDILAEYGWHQTVKSDLPHFTYLGVKESELPKLGLKKVVENGHHFWIPNF